MEKDSPVLPSPRQRDAPARWGARGQSLPDVQRLLRHSCSLLVLRTCVSRGRRRDVVVSQQQIHISDKREALPAGAAEDALPAAGHFLKRISKAPNGHAYLYRNRAKGGPLPPRCVRPCSSPAGADLARSAASVFDTLHPESRYTNRRRSWSRCGTDCSAL